MDSTAEDCRSVHYRSDGTECTGDCDVRCKEKGGDELRRLMRRINEQRMKVRSIVGSLYVVLFSSTYFYVLPLVYLRPRAYVRVSLWVLFFTVVVDSSCCNVTKKTRASAYKMFVRRSGEGYGVRGFYLLLWDC